jgi:putative ABC transport system substrate-binding protein
VTLSFGALLLTLALAHPVAATEAPTVVVIQLGTAEPYEIALQALTSELDPEARLVVQKIDPRDANAGARVADLEPDVLVPIGTRATSWALESTTDIPIVFAMVLNPVSSKLVKSADEPGGRITGATLDISVESQLRTLRDAVNADRVAVMFNPAKTQAVVDEARRAAARAGIELVPIEVHDPTQLERALDRVDGSFDALWSVADQTVLAGGAVQRVLLHTLKRRVPYMGLSEQYVRAGALLALTASYEENGRQAAALVRRVAAGEQPGSLPLATPQNVEVVFNPKTAERLELNIRLEVGLPLRPVR